MITFKGLEEFIVMIHCDGHAIAAMSEPTTEKMEAAVKDWTCYTSVKVKEDVEFCADDMTKAVVMQFTDDELTFSGTIMLSAVLKY